MSSGLTIRVRCQQDCAIVTVAGEIDIASVARLRERLSSMAAGGLPLIVDLNGVGFIDAAGLGVLAGAASQAAAHGVSLQVACAQPRTRRLLLLTRLDRHLRLAFTVAEARQALAAEKTMTSNDPPRLPRLADCKYQVVDDRSPHRAAFLARSTPVRHKGKA